MGEIWVSNHCLADWSLLASLAILIFQRFVRKEKHMIALVLYVYVCSQRFADNIPNGQTLHYSGMVPEDPSLVNNTFEFRLPVIQSK